MTLEDVEARIFGFFVHWLYTQTHRGTKKDTPNLIEYAKFYTLSDRFMVSPLKKQLLHALRWTYPNLHPETGNTLEDFQDYAYSANGDEILRIEALLKSQRTLNADNLEVLIRKMPNEMLADFSKQVSRTWLNDRESLSRQSRRLLELGDMDDVVFDDEFPDHER